MSQPLDEFINAIRMADSIEQERFLMKTEEAHIRAYVRDGDPELRPRVVSKLVFLDMLGENLSWGQMEAITLMTHDRFSYKRVGYIGASIILDENAELSVLVTQTLLRDLQSPDPNIQCLALTFIANCGSAEVSRAVASEVQKLVGSRYPMVMKRAGMAIVRIVRKNPDLTDSFKNTVQRLLNQNSHGVIISGMNLVIAMIENEPKLVQTWSQFSIPFTKILKNLSNSRGSREFNYGLFNDPMMLIKTLSALALLKKGSEELDGILQSIISSAETRRNTGRAVLYQALDTIVTVSTKPSLRGLAFNQVGRLLSMRDPNVLYSALSSFARVLNLEKSMINRGSVDSMALQRYKMQIVHCLNHNDPSIRRRALDVISALIDEQNVESLVPEILAYVKLADAEFRTELIAKIYSASQRFAPSPEWNFNTVHQILIESGNYVSSDIISSFCELIAKSPDLQVHAVSKLRKSLALYGDNQSLLQVSAFILGEFCKEDNDDLIITPFKSIISLPQTTVETKLYIITALAKLAYRLGTAQEMATFLNEVSESNDLEVQQRAGEMARLLLSPNLSSAVLTPIVNTDADSEKRTVRVVTNDDQKASLIDVGPTNQNTSMGGGAADDDDDLLSLVMDDSGLSKQTNQSNRTSATTNDALLDLMGDVSQPTNQVSAVSASSNSDLHDLLGGSTQNQVASNSEIPRPPGSIDVMKANDFIVFGQVQPNSQNPKQYALRLLFYNCGNMQLTSLKTEYHIQPGWQIQVQPLDSQIIKPKGSQPTTQIIFLNNATNAPLSLQIKVSYYFGSQPLSEKGVLTSLK